MNMKLTVAEVLQAGVQAHVAGNFQEAERAYKAILDRQPNHADANHNLGALIKKRGDSSSALPFFRKALESNPQEAQFWLSYVKSLIDLEDFEAAEHFLNSAKQQGHIGEKFETLQEVLSSEWSKKEPNLVEWSAPSTINVKLVSLYRANKRLLGLKYGRQALVLYPNLSPAYNILSLIYAANNENHQCLEIFKRCLILNPVAADVINNLSSTLVDYRIVDKAIGYGKKAVMLRPDSSEGYNNLGRGLGVLGHHKNALRYLEAAVKIDTKQPVVLLNLAINLRAVGENERALKVLKSCLDLDYQLVEAHEESGNLLSILGKERAAEDKFLSALKLDPSRVSSRISYANFLKKRGRLGEALAHIEVGLRADKDSENAKLLAADIHFELGDYRKSIDLYDQSILKKPLNSMIYNNLAVIQDKVGHHSAARRNCFKALILNPHNLMTLMGMANTESKVFRERNIANWISCLLPKRPTANQSKLGKNFEITALFCFGRSGSLFFQSLFDGHPQVATIPGVYLKNWFTDSSWAPLQPNFNNKYWRLELAKQLVEQYLPAFDARCRNNVPGRPLGPGIWLSKGQGFMEMGVERKDYFYVNKEEFICKFEGLLREYGFIDRRKCFELFHIAFNYACFGDSKLRPHIFYHIHNPSPEEVRAFAEFYPASRYLYIFREPIQTLESWMLNSKFEQKKDFASRMTTWMSIAGYLKSLIYLLSIPSKINSEARGVRLEDVKNQAHSIMPKIASWMGLENHTTLYEAKFGGLDYWGPDSSSGPVKGFDPASITYAKGRFFSDKDISILETLFWPFMQQYFYTQLPEKKFKAELNRIEPLIKQPFDFEKRLYKDIKHNSLPLEELTPYKIFHGTLETVWDRLHKDPSFQQFILPLT